MKLYRYFQYGPTGLQDYTHTHAECYKKYLRQLLKRWNYEVTEQGNGMENTEEPEFNKNPAVTDFHLGSRPGRH